jgi:hypothetical protein
LKDLLDSQQKPDFIASDLSSVLDLLAEIEWENYGEA